MAGPNKAGKCENRYCEIPGGTFSIGSRDGDQDAPLVEGITMTGFLLGETEVSVGQYRLVVSGYASGSSPVIPDFPENKKGDNYPIVGLTFDQKQAFCQAEGGMLASAAQLHFASRYDEQDIAADRLVIWENSFTSTEPVDVGQRNRFGILHLLGNAWESTGDAYDPLFYIRMSANDPYNPFPDQGSLSWGPEFSGGSFDSSRRSARAASRGNDLNRHPNSVGFRCMKPLPK